MCFQEQSGAGDQLGTVDKTTGMPVAPPRALPNPTAGSRIDPFLQLASPLASIIGGIQGSPVGRTLSPIANLARLFK